MQIANNILATIGNTPLVRINRLIPDKDVEIIAKLEGSNPGGSVKDRIALRMIEAAEESGELTKDKVIIEPTSGNTGIGMAMVAAVKGYRLTIVMSEGVSMERRKTLAAYGAELVLTPAKEGTDGAIRKTIEMVKRDPQKYFFPNQFTNKYNPLAHYKTTAEEIWRQTDGELDYFVASIGTSGTLMGVGTHLREKDPFIRIIAAEPTLGHKLQGMKNMNEAIVPEIYKEHRIDAKIVVQDADGYGMSRRLAREEGIFVGMSAGAAMWAALELAKTLKKGRIVVLLADRGDRYLSTPLFDRLTQK